jgi:hypothetical protein
MRRKSRSLHQYDAALHADCILSYRNTGLVRGRVA